ncbi:hypothetical protein HPK19_19440 [Arthrobacter citreus]|nr:hypothetical protein HPK19_19440 [Arthrobacter citreus]
MEIYIIHDEKNVITAVSTSPIGDNPIAVEVETMEIFENPSAYRYIDGQVVKDESLILEIAKTKKMSDLGTECDNTILGRFKATIDGVEYLFSNDSVAQANFDKLMFAFDKGFLTEIRWTAYDMEGNVVRVLITPPTMITLFVAHLTHIQENIVKLRDILQPQVESATVEELELITW